MNLNQKFNIFSLKYVRRRYFRLICFYLFLDKSQTQTAEIRFRILSWESSVFLQHGRLKNPQTNI